MNTLLTTAELRGERSVNAALGLSALSVGNGRRTVFDCRNSTVIPSATVARTEDGAASADASVNEAFDGLGTTREFFKDVFDRNSIDDHGMRLDGFVHFDASYNNAFWDGRRMVFGDGDGVLFSSFTKSLDVIAHELGHGVTESSAGLEYHNESGALNESMSDVFGSLVKQWFLNQTADEADWLIGSEIFTPNLKGDSLRSMKAPGTAYDNDEFGRDPQPDHMSRYVQLPDTQRGDWGGVHINSGIPNKAFFLVAKSIGGAAWQAPGKIWYDSLKASNVRTQFQEFANTTYAKAGQLFGQTEQDAVADAWNQVGLRITGVPIGPRGGRRKSGEAQSPTTPSAPPEIIKALNEKVDAIAAQLRALSKEIDTLKGTARKG